MLILKLVQFLAIHILVLSQGKNVFSVKNCWSVIRAHNASRYALLLATPVFVKPLDFDSTQKKPVHLRLKGLWTLPLLVASAWAYLISTWIAWGYEKSARPTVTLSEALQALKNLESMSTVFVTAVALILLYGISFSRWAYHSAAIKLLSKRYSGLTRPHCLFFVVNTSAWGMWLALGGYCVFQAMKWWVNAEQPVFVADAANMTESLLHVAVVVALGGVLKLTTRNNTLGMTALYGGHRGLTFLVRLVSILILFLLGTITLLF